VIENIADGQHELVCEGADEEEQWESHWMFTVFEQPEDLTTISAEATTGQHAYTSEETGLDFLLHIPEDYGQEPGYEWPLILFLHGTVDGLRNMGQLRRQPLPAVLESDVDFPFIVVSPLRQEGRGDFKYWFREEHLAPLFDLLDEVQATYSVDPQRIYLSGESAGGNGVWEIGLQYPDQFAALAPVSGYYGYSFIVPDNICDLKDVPVWAFHGALDESVPLDAEQSLVDALNECGGQAQITVFPDLGHDLDFEQVYTPELADWLLSHTMAE
jgi:predicted peptidase